MEYADIKIKLAVFKDTLKLLTNQLDELFEEAWTVNRLSREWNIKYPNNNPLPELIEGYGLIEKENKETGKMEIINLSTARPLPVPQPPPVAPKKPRQKKKQVVVASPTGPVADEILNM